MSQFWSQIQNPMRALGIFSGAIGDPLATLFGVGMDQLLGSDDGGGRDSSGDVAFMTGQLLKSQYEDWKKTFMPIELRALKEISINNPSVLPTALDEASGTVKNLFGTMEGVLERQNRSLGLTPTTSQANATKRIMDLGEASTLASAKNATRSNVRQMDDALLMGSVPNPNIAKSKTGVNG